MASHDDDSRDANAPTAQPGHAAAPPAGNSPQAAFAALVELMRILRSPEGCPWDRVQTLDTLKPFVLEEAYEVVDAIERGDLAGLKGEIGDLVFEGVFLAELCSEQPAEPERPGGFTITDALNDVRAKLVRRHPHVFAPEATSGTITTPRAVKEQWDQIKAAERAERGDPGHGLFDRMPAAMPALRRAHDLGTRAASVGFDWPRPLDVLDKVAEEVAELREELQASMDRPANAIEEELGDLLFAITNFARKLGIDPEAALRGANRKFIDRFTRMQELLASRGVPLDQATLDDMESAWQEIKGKP